MQKVDQVIARIGRADVIVNNPGAVTAPFITRKVPGVSGGYRM